ncbi:FAD-dependent oxidoreductase [Waterburya agarophytonicola K14]|uniref:FAD-dependent oxidoreductase n=1 Tax=Waterburya agarophytonicola KI4 TaxID=2874699 RepID=A0A964BL82_9CYAN|nr:FAD-dependent oxidoreductase [Waterburya agarophytonicola]MCC0175444.1 FAD-dependent oxidoreductase [Waterburya agarophytonicola KI4]
MSKNLKQKLVLVGGGHSHAIALRLWGLDPMPDIDLILISDVGQTPYSGMLPGHVAGFYSYAETHIDLNKLAQFAGAELIIDRAINLDLDNHQIVCESGKQITFDYLSLDIGSTPQTITVPGAAQYAIAAKPVPKFLDAWYSLQKTAADRPKQALSIVIVGGGAGGVELALNMQACLSEIIDKPQDRLQIHLIHRGDRLLSGHNDWVSHKLKKIILNKGIKLHLQEEVAAVFPDRVRCKSGLDISCNRVFWVTQAVAPPWIEESSLTCDRQGFILVRDTLQSVSHPEVFAAGDIATMTNYQRPKAGVFAVRQGRPLLHNWQQILQNQPLQVYTPQDKYLALIGTGDGKAIASWSKFGWHSALLWRVKDYIDRQFMNQFEG